MSFQRHRGCRTAAISLHLVFAVIKNRLHRNVLALLVGIFLGGVSVVAFASTYNSSWRYFTSSHPNQNATGWDSACSYTASQVGETFYGITGYVNGDGFEGSYGYCAWSRTGPPTCPTGVTCGWNSGIKVERRRYCPNGGTLSADKLTCTVTPSCQQGAAGTASWWTGCFDVDGIDNGCDAGTRFPYPVAGVCDGSCVVDIDTWTICTLPVGGGPIVCTGNGTLTGASCQPGDNYIPPNSQKCPSGYAIGTFNGQIGCYKSGPTDPVNTTTTQSTDPQTGVVTTTTTTTNTTNNTTTTTTTVYNPATGSTTSTQQTSPLDPNKPMYNDKAPGENQNPYEIDETGTPTDGSLSQAKSDYETAANAHKTFIDGLASQGNHGMVWDWTFQLPSGTCSAYTFTIAGKSFTLDPCEKLGMVRDVLGFLIYITTALALLSIATGYGKEGK